MVTPILSPEKNSGVGSTGDSKGGITERLSRDQGLSIEEEELLAAVAAEVPVRVRPPTEYEEVGQFLGDVGLMPGTTQSVQVSDIYRRYRVWGGELRPFQFARQLKRYEFPSKKQQHRRPKTAVRLLLMRRESAERMLEWVKEHPVPMGFKEWFRAHFFGWTKRENPADWSEW